MTGMGATPTRRDPGDAVAAGECGPGEPAEPSSWHGSHVAGTIGVGQQRQYRRRRWGELAHAGPGGARAGQVRRLDRRHQRRDRWAAGLPVPGVPTNPTPARVINMSLGARRALQRIALDPGGDQRRHGGRRDGGGCGGEFAMDASGALPASCIGPITVAASDARGFLVTRYSNFGPRIDIWHREATCGATTTATATWTAC